MTRLARFHGDELSAAAALVAGSDPGTTPGGRMVCEDCMPLFTAKIALMRETALRDPDGDLIVQVAGLIRFGIEVGLALAIADDIDPGGSRSQLALRLGRYILERGDQPGGISIGFDQRDDEWFGMAMFGRESPDSDMVGGANHSTGDTLDDGRPRPTRRGPDMTDQTAAWRHVAATAIIRRLVEGRDPQAVSAGVAFLETEHPTPDEYAAAMLEETERRIGHDARRTVPPPG